MANTHVFTGGIMVWNGEDVSRNIHNDAGTRLARATIMFERDLKRLVSKTGREGGGKGPRKPTKRTGLASAATGRRVVSNLKGLAVPAKRTRRKGGVVHSRPGHPPHRQTGAYMGSIGHSIDRRALRSAVYTTMRLGVWLELGTRRMEARPHWIVIARRMAPKFPEFFRGMV